MKILLPIIAMTIMAGQMSMARAEDHKIPYNGINTAMKVLESKKIDGIDCVPFYLKDKRKGVTLDPAVARCRIQTWDGPEVPIKVEALSSIPANQLTKIERKVMADGYTHRMWLPKDDKRLLDGNIVNSNPVGLDMIQGTIIASGKIKL